MAKELPMSTSLNLQMRCAGTGHTHRQPVTGTGSGRVWVWICIWVVATKGRLAGAGGPDAAAPKWAAMAGAAQAAPAQWRHGIAGRPGPQAPPPPPTLPSHPTTSPTTTPLASRAPQASAPTDLKARDLESHTWLRLPAACVRKCMECIV